MGNFSFNFLLIRQLAVAFLINLVFQNFLVAFSPKEQGSINYHNERKKETSTAEYIKKNAGRQSNSTEGGVVPQSTTPVTTSSDEFTKRRWISFGFLNVDFGEVRLGLMRQAIADGCNAVHINVNWEKVYPSRGSAPQWGELDEQVALAKELGAKLIIRIWVARHEPWDDGSIWWTRSQKPIDPEGRYCAGVQSFSFNDQPSLDEAANFVKEVAEHYKSYQESKDILYMSVVNSQTSEAHYSIQAKDGKGGNVISTFDYSDVSINAWRQWLQVKYKTIAALNAAWHTDHSRFENVYPINYPNTMYQYNFSWQTGQDWYMFRHYSLKKFIDKMCLTVKSVDNSYQFVPDFGSVFDELSILRATYGFKDLSSLCDGVKNNNGPSHPHAFIADLLRSNVKPNQWIGTEVDASATYATASDFDQQINEWFEHGGNIINLFGFDIPEYYPRVKNTIIKAKAKWLTDPYVQPIEPVYTVSYKLSDPVTKLNTYDVQAAWRDKATSQKNPVRVILDEDLVESLPVENVQPVVVKEIPNQSTIKGEQFNYEIDKTTFKDDDGYIALLSAEGLPEGITLNGWKLSGKAIADGNYEVKIKATDNSGGTVTTSFVLTVLASQKKNVISLYTAGNFLTRRFIQNIANGDTLLSDEMKNAVNVLVSPVSGSVGSYSFALTGPVNITTFDNQTPYGLFGDNGGQVLTKGQYDLTIKSYTAVNLAGTLIAEEKIRFYVPEIIRKNQAPALFTQPSDLFAEVGRSFQFTLSDSTFVDYDGQVTGYTVTGLPAGLTANGTVIAGTPTTSGVYTVTVKATDNSGDASTTTFSFTVAAENKAPVVAKVIPDQSAEQSVPFSFAIPEGTFTDSDGSVARLEVSGLPDGLTFGNTNISGTPTKTGEFNVTVVAFDNKNASVSTGFKIRVGAPNKAPVLSEPIPDMIAIIGQTFRIDVKGFFKDTDGTIASVSYLASLPAGMKSEGSVLSGDPTVAGVYTIAVRATDNKGATVDASFKLTVENTVLTIDLFAAGDAGSRQKIQTLTNGVIIASVKLPSQINIFASSNSTITSVAFEMSGPESKKSTDDAAPFGIFGDAGGFQPKVGSYNLKVSAYRNGTLVISRTLRFDIIKAGNSNVRQGVSEEEESISEIVKPEVMEEIKQDVWKSFPNPFTDKIQINTNFSALSEIDKIEIHSMTGTSEQLTGQEFKLNGTILDLDLARTAKVPGLYIITIVDMQSKRRSIKVMKVSQ